MTGGDGVHIYQAFGTQNCSDGRRKMKLAIRLCNNVYLCRPTRNSPVDLLPIEGHTYDTWVTQVAEQIVQFYSTIRSYWHTVCSDTCKVDNYLTRIQWSSWIFFNKWIQHNQWKIYLIQICSPVDLPVKNTVSLNPQIRKLFCFLYLQ